MWHVKVIFPKQNDYAQYIKRLSIKWEILIIIILISIKVNDLISLLLLHTFLNIKWKCECHFSRHNLLSFRIFCQNTNVFKGYINGKIITLKDVYFFCFSTLKNSSFLFISFLFLSSFCLYHFFRLFSFLRGELSITSHLCCSTNEAQDWRRLNETKRENEKRVGLGLKDRVIVAREKERKQRGMEKEKQEGVELVVNRAVARQPILFPLLRA